MVSPATLIDHRYQIEAKIGQGAGGVVYRVYDTKLKRRLALKVLRTDRKDPDALQRIEREFQAIRELRHPNILAVHDFEKNYFTMEFVQGEPLDPAVRRDVHEIVALASVICRALRYIHAQGMIHGDLKPPHVLVGPHGEIKLIDFGLSEPFQVTSDRPQAAAGTLDYMAPEVFQGRRSDLRTDLYSLGVLLYELCTGRLPFAAQDAVGLIMKHIEAAPRPPRELRPDLPRELERLILRLLAKDPAERYPSADAVLEVLTALGGQKEILKARVEKGSRHLFDPALVGRDEETALLARSVQEASAGHPRTVILRGEPGMGRTRLLSELRARHLFTPHEVLTAAAVPEPDRAWVPFDAIAEQAVFALERRAPRRLAEGIARWGPGIVSLAPDLAQREAWRSVQPRRFPDGRTAATDLLALLATLAQETPVLCVLDDIHCVDHTGAALLAHLLPAVAAPVRLAVVLAADARADDASREFAAAKEALDRAGCWTERVLQPLARAQIVRLAASMLGSADLDGLLAGRLVEVARGNPMVAEEAVRSLAEQEVLYKKGGVWQVDVRALESAQWTGRLGDWLWRKVRQMVKAAPRHLEVLNAAAAVGDACSFDVLRQATRLDTTVLYYALADLVREGLLREGKSQGRRQYVLGAPAMAEGLLQDIPERRLRKLRADAVAALEEERTRGVPVPPATLADLHAACGDPARAIERGMEAAQAAAGRQATRRALSLYGKVLGWCDEADDAARAAQVLVTVGGLEYAAGDLAHARERFEQAVQRAGEEGGILREAHEGLGRIALRRRSFEEAIGHFQRLRALLAKEARDGAPDPAASARVSVWLGRVHQARQEWDEALRHFQQAVGTAPQEGDAPLQAQIARRIGEVHLACGRFGPAQESLRAAIRHAEGNAPLAFRAWLSMGELYRSTGQLEEARALVTRLSAEAADHPPRQQAVLHLLDGLVHGKSGDLAAARRGYRAATTILEREQDAALLAQAHERYADLLLEFVRTAPLRLRDEARRALKETAEAYRAIGAATAADRIDGLLAGAGREAVDADLVALRAERDNLQFLQRIGRIVNQELDLDRLLDLIMDHVIDVVKAERGFLILAEEDGSGGQELRVAVGRNLDHEAIREPEFKISHSIAKAVLDEQKPILTRDAQSDERFRNKISVTNLKLRSILCVPLSHRRRALGAVYVDNRFVSERFSEGNLRLLTAFADQASIALVNARLHRENLRRAHELEEANRAVQSLNTKLQEQVSRQYEELREAKQTLEERQHELQGRYGYHAIVGRSPAMQEVYGRLERLREVEVPVLLQGESGTGKELVARAIHFTGVRKDRPFVTENCAAIAPSLLEAELFGAMRGAYTGATKDRKGLFEAAHTGTLFLDEIGELEMDLQSKLLRALESGEIRRLGATAPVRVDVRILSASNRDLAARVKEGKFREDLFYRLNVVRIDLPPLRERRQDIPLLAEAMLEEIAKRPGQVHRTIATEAMRRLMESPWEGNVRELKNFLERISVFARGPVLTLADVEGALPRPSAPTVPGLGKPYRDGRRMSLEAFDREWITASLARNGGNVSAAAKEMGIERQYMYKLMKRCGVEPSQFKD